MEETYQHNIKDQKELGKNWDDNYDRVSGI